MAISSVTNRNDAGQYSWDKTAKDVNDIDENFQNARDLGYLRLNVSRLNVIGSLGKFNNVDIFKVQMQSTGKFSLSLRAENKDDPNKKVLDLSKYDEDLKAAEKMIDPEGYAARLEEEMAQEEDKKLLSYTAPGTKVEVYMVKNGREVLVAASDAKEGSKQDIAMKQMLTGEYKATQGNYYVKVSYDEKADKNIRESMGYVMQLQIGNKYKHDYLVTQKSSDDTKNKVTSKTPSAQSNGVLSAGNAMLIQAGKYQETSNMMIDSYLNLASIYNKNKNYFDF